MSIIVNHESKQFKYEINSNIEDYNNDNYLNLIKSIQEAFGLECKFSLQKVVLGAIIDIHDMDDIKSALQNVQIEGDENNNNESNESNENKNTLHLHVKLALEDDEKRAVSTGIDADYAILSTTKSSNDESDGFELNGNDEKEIESEVDDLYKWCTKHGFHKYYDQFVDDFGVKSLEEIIESSMDDLFDVCSELQFTEDEKQRFLNIIVSSNENNELLLWCKNNKLDKFYDLLLKSGYFSPIQIGHLSKQERIKLCKELGIKFGAKKRFENALPGIIDVKDRKIIHIKSNVSQIDNDIALNRTILLVGETGTGKTATINSMMNYLYDAQFEGNRYKLIEEKFDDKSAVESQTNEVSVYYLTPPTIDYALTIVDTPGFGNCDSKGIQFDQKITEKLEHLFKTKVTEIDGICFVVKSNQTRLTERQQYIFREIIDLFGKNVANNIILLFTFDDGTEIPFGLEAVNKSRSPIPHRDKYFKFNNNGFDFVLDEKKRGNFNEAMEAFGDFFEEITKTQTQSLQLSQQVLEQRKELKLAIKRAEHRLKDGLIIYQLITNRIKYIEENKDEINKSDATLLTIEIPETRKVVVKKKQNSWLPMMERHKMKDEKEEKMPLNKDILESFYVCEQCELTCEYSKMQGQWVCWNCNKRDNIRKAKYKYELALKKITVPVKQLESGYLDASIYQPLSDTLIEKETVKLKQAEHDLIELIAQIRKCIHKIKQLALNKTILTPTDYFNLLIEEEKKNCINGWEDRVNALKSLQKQHILIEKIEKSVQSENIESIFPEFNTIKSFHEETEKKENERVHNMQKKNLVDSNREKKQKTQIGIQNRNLVVVLGGTSL